MNLSRVVLRLTILLILLSLFGCWPDSEPAPIRAKILYSVGASGPGTWNQKALDGAESALLFDSDGHFTANEIMFFSPESEERAATKFYSWLDLDDEGYREVIIPNSFYFQPLVEQGECNFGNKKLLLFDGSVSNCSSVKSVQFEGDKAAFVVGFMAMHISTTKRAAVIGGAAIPPTLQYSKGFCDGVRNAGGICYIHYIPATLDGFSNEEETAFWASLYYEHKNVDVLFAAAGYANRGIFSAAEAAEGRYVLGSDTNQNSLSLTTILGSVVRKNDKSIEDILNSMKTRGFSGGLEILGYDSEYLTVELNKDHPKYQQFESMREAAEEAMKTWQEQQ